MLNNPGNLTGTVIHPAILVLTIVACILIIFINSRHSIFLIIALSIMMPLGQNIKVFTLNFTIFRVLLLVGWIRIIFSKDLTLGKFEKTDKAIIYWVIVSFIVYIIHHYNIYAIKNQLGFAYNAIGVYFIFRILIKTKEDIDTIFNTLAIVSAMVAIFMLYEQWSGGKNWFYVLGGVNEFTLIRLGRIRSQGPFGHAICAGVFGATMFPLCFSMWRHKWGSAFFGIIGALSACVLVITSTSSTSLIAGVAGFAALLFWPLRNKMGMVRYGILFCLVILQIIMTSPVFSVIQDLALIKGSSGLHRFMLVDNLISRFDEWFLLGSLETAKWGNLMDDQSNQYYFEAVTGGFFKLALFTMIIVFSFSNIGKKIKIITDTPSRKLFWALGSALFAILVGFIGISLWDQLLFIWFLLLALITSTSLLYGGKNLTVDEVSKK